MSKISLRHVHKSFQKNHDVINDFSLEIFDHEFLVLVGASGSGKTTTLRMIAGLEEITKGELLIDGVLQNDEDPSQRHLSFVFQNYALLPHLTIYDNIAFGLLNTNQTVNEKKKAVEDIANKLSLSDKLGNYPNQLSGGQRQRVALARALVDNASLVLFDEPLSNLDAVLRTGMRNELIRNHESFGVTSIYVTHDQTEAMAMASRIVLLQEGKIMQVGTPNQMYNDPCHLHVAQSIGTPEVNVLEARVVDKEIYLEDRKIRLDNRSLSLIEKRNLNRFQLVIRPQDIAVFAEPAQGRILGEIALIENFGMIRLLHVKALGKTIRILSTNHYDRFDNLYFEWGEKILLFDEYDQRIRLEGSHTIHFDREPEGDHERQVLSELRNYGYDLSFRHSHPNIRFDDRSGRYVLNRDKQDIVLSDLVHVLSHFPYIKTP
jgi:multiple sugar transport system ATP-binding protein